MCALVQDSLIRRAKMVTSVLEEREMLMIEEDSLRRLGPQLVFCWIHMISNLPWSRYLSRIRWCGIKRVEFCVEFGVILLVILIHLWYD